MTPAQLEALRESRAELAALRVTLRRERADLALLALEATSHEDPAPAEILYALHNLADTDRALTTALEALRPLLDAEESER